MKRVLFLCTHNSARSQMAEGLLRSIAGDEYEVFSAGTGKTRVRPLAIEAMKEAGIDITGHTSKTLDPFLDQEFDAVITVCDSVNASCPTFSRAKGRLHWSFPDPSKSNELKTYIEVRDAIRAKIESWISGT